MTDAFLYTRTIEILTSMAIGAFLCWMGYKLFFVKLSDKSNMDIEYGKLKLKLLDASPGIFFVLFGTVLISFSLIKSSKFQEEITSDKDKLVIKRIIEKSADSSGTAALENFIDITNNYNNVAFLRQLITTI